MFKILQSGKQNQFTALFFLFIGISLYFILSLGSFSPHDPSQFAVSSHHLASKNLGGAIGASISGIFFYHIGLVSFCLPALLFLLFHYQRKLLLSLFIVQSMIVLLYVMQLYYPTHTIFNLTLPSAGATGYWLTKTINNAVGVYGAHILLLTVLGYFVILLGRVTFSPVRKAALRVIPRNFTNITNKPTEKKTTEFSFSTSLSTSYEEAETDEYQKNTATMIKKTLAEFKINGAINAWNISPMMTVYEFQPQSGTKQVQVTSLANEIALALQVDSVQIEPIPYRRALGIQIPNQHRSVVHLGDILSSAVFKESKSKLTFALGKGIDDKPVCQDLQTMPHLLIAGSTGSGKSVAINALLCSILSRATPQEVRLLLIDPKMLELSAYNDVPHLLRPVVTDIEAAQQALSWACDEMQRRYEVLQKLGAKNVETFREKWQQLANEEKTTLRDRYKDLKEIDSLPYIVFIIDELADLMLIAGKQVEKLIQRLTQKARASGIHLVLATQRPSVDVITGVIKANLPCRLAFTVASKHDSRTILDIMGAEKLLGKGDMLLQQPAQARPVRIQGAYVTDDEVKALIKYIAS